MPTYRMAAMLLVFLSTVAVVDGSHIGSHAGEFARGYYKLWPNAAGTNIGDGACHPCPFCTGPPMAAPNDYMVNSCRALGGGQRWDNNAPGATPGETLGCTTAGCATHPFDPNKCCRQGCYGDPNTMDRSIGLTLCPPGTNNAGAPTNAQTLNQACHTVAGWVEGLGYGKPELTRAPIKCKIGTFKGLNGCCSSPASSSYGAGAGITAARYYTEPNSRSGVVSITGGSSHMDCDGCPAGMTTLQEGSMMHSDCKAKAGYYGRDPEGYLHEQGAEGYAAAPCAVGKYKIEVGPAACVDCPTGSSTAGTTGFHQCQTDAGYTGIAGAGAPTACVAGKYKDAIGDALCKDCPLNSGTGVTEGSTTVHACNVITDCVAAVGCTVCDGDVGAIDFAGNTDGGKWMVTKPMSGFQGQSFSFTMWVKMASLGVSETFFTWGDNSGTNTKIEATLRSGNSMAFSLGGTWVQTANDSFADDVNVWVHHAFTFNKDNLAMEIHRDGVKAIPANATGNSGTASATTGNGLDNKIHIGQDKWDNTQYFFTGMLDEFLVFKLYSLSTADIMSIYQATGGSPNYAQYILMSLSFDAGADVLQDFSCGGSLNAESSNGLVAVKGKVCGSWDVDNAIACGT